MPVALLVHDPLRLAHVHGQLLPEAQPELVPKRDNEHARVVLVLHKLLLSWRLLFQLGVLHFVRTVRGGHVLLGLSDGVHDVPGEHVRGRGRVELHALSRRRNVPRGLDVVLRLHLVVRRVRVDGDGVLVSELVVYGLVSSVREHVHVRTHREPVRLRRGARAADLLHVREHVHRLLVPIVLDVLRQLSLELLRGLDHCLCRRLLGVRVPRGKLQSRRWDDLGILRTMPSKRVRASRQ